MVLSFGLIIAGAVLVAADTPVSVNIVGFFMIFAGIILLIVLRTAYKDAETGVYYSKKEKYFPQSKRDSLLRAISAGMENLDLAEEDKGNGLRLDVFYSRKTGKAFVRLYEYIPYKYEPCSPFYGLGCDRVANLIK